MRTDKALWMAVLIDVRRVIVIVFGLVIGGVTDVGQLKRTYAVCLRSLNSGFQSGKIRVRENG